MKKASLLLIALMAVIIIAGCLQEPQKKDDIGATVVSKDKNFSQGVDIKGKDVQARSKIIAEEFKKVRNPFRYLEKDAYIQEMGIDAGKLIYDKDCASCHGGPKESGASDNSFSDLSAGSMSDLDERYLMTVITYGIKDPKVKGFKDELSIEERWQVLSYVCSLNESGVCKVEKLPPSTFASDDTAKMTSEDVEMIDKMYPSPEAASSETSEK